MNVIVKTINPSKFYKDLVSVRPRADILYTVYNPKADCTFGTIKEKLNLNNGMLTYKGDIVEDTKNVKDTMKGNLVLSYLKN